MDMDIAKQERLVDQEHLPEELVIVSETLTKNVSQDVTARKRFI